MPEESTHTPEEWRSVDGYEGLYEVSDHARVRRVHHYRYVPRPHHLLKAWPNSSGYLRVQLSKDAVVQWWFVHRLVAAAFIPNPQGRDIVNHIDSDFLNNRPLNLEWVTSSENSIHAVAKGRTRIGIAVKSAKLTPPQVLQIRALKGSVGVIAVSRRYNISPGAIYRIWNGTGWRHLS